LANSKTHASLAWLNYYMKAVIEIFSANNVISDCSVNMRSPLHVDYCSKKCVVCFGHPDIQNFLATPPCVCNGCKTVVVVVFKMLLKFAMFNEF